MFRSLRRAGLVSAGAAVLVLVGGNAAFAHHCYKADWNDAAYAHHAGGGTAWTPLSDLADTVIAEDIGLPQCVGYGDQVAQVWMEATGVEQEPLIHSRATAGGGAAHRGKEPKPFNYLGQEDFVILDAALGAAIEDCLAAG
jgi:hypothetical protein